MPWIYAALHRPVKILALAIVASLAAVCESEDALPAVSPPPDLSQPHAFGVHDMVRMQRVGEPHLSPDGQWIVFTVRSWDPEVNKTTTNLWLSAIDGSTIRQLTSGKAQTDTSPAWSPDSRVIAFISNRSGSRQIWAIAVDGGEAIQLTTLPVDVDNLRWSPKGSHIAFSAEVYPDADMETTAKRDKAKADNPVKAMKFDRLFIRHWDTWADGKRNHIFAIPVKQGASGWRTSGESTDLMKGVDADCPSKPFGGGEEFDWSPEGEEIAYTAQPGKDIAWSTDSNI